uniref:Limb development membrane protein 1 n=1 Tax=Erpetoichthys calabaricus TaxID=27687 RepID=A0A8C4TM30_ERPCA
SMTVDHNWARQLKFKFKIILQYVNITLKLIIVIVSISVVIKVISYLKISEEKSYYLNFSFFVALFLLLYLCTFTLAVSAGAVLLLPFSIISNEIVLSFPKNYYIQWLNGSLIHGLWNLVSLFSNFCLFMLMPFAYFFLESEGFAGSKKGIKARILETFVMLILLGLLILGIVWVASALLDNDAASKESLYDLWEFYLPYLYSCISLMGGLLLLLCTPVGLSRMFTVMGQLLVNLFLAFYVSLLYKKNLRRDLFSETRRDLVRKTKDTFTSRETRLQRRKKASVWEKNLAYPLVMVILLAGTAISVFLVALNILYLLVDETAMPKGSKEQGIGSSSLFTFGFVGAALEIFLIFYLMVSSVVGFYSLRVFEGLTPMKDDTTMTTVSYLPYFPQACFLLLAHNGSFHHLPSFFLPLTCVFLFDSPSCISNSLLKWGRGTAGQSAAPGVSEGHG